MSEIRNDIVYLEEVIARRNERIKELEVELARYKKLNSGLVTKSNFYLVESARLEEQVIALQEQLAGWRQNAAFYRSCALGGEVPADKAQPYIDPLQEQKG